MAELGERTCVCTKLTFICLLFLCMLRISQASQSEKDFEFTDTESHNVQRREASDLDDAFKDDEDFFNDQEGSGPDRVEGSAIGPEVPDYPVYYRVTVFFNSVGYQEALSDRNTDLFSRMSTEISQEIESIYRSLPGQQLVNIIEYKEFDETPPREGTLVTFDLGVRDTPASASLKKILETQIESGSVGRYRVSKAGYEFHDLRKGAATCPANIGREPSKLPRTGNNWANLLVNFAFPCAGQVQAWQYYRIIGPGVAYVGIWRPVSETEYTLIGKTLIPEQEPGFHTVELEEPITVNQGDFVGIHYPQRQESGVIASSIASDGAVPINELYQNYYVEMFDEMIHKNIPINIDGLSQSVMGAAFALQAVMDYPRTVRPTVRGDIPIGTCEPEQFMCPDRDFCVFARYVCDGIDDCKDGADETEEKCAEVPPCTPNQFPCGSGDCIPLNQVCNNEYDCIDASDERDCPTGGPRCGVNEFRCLDGTCIDIALKCDSRADCSDGTDEYNCESTPCQPGEYRCERGQCIDERLRCDGKLDCPSRSDELDCQCKPDEFRCEDGRCITNARTCDGFRDCADGSDEDPFICGIPDCPENLFKCETSGDCIARGLVCNRVNDCADGSDERTCDCSPDDFQCADGACIDPRLRCDGVSDCNDGSDEENCPGCREHQFQCNDRSCIDLRQRCDRRQDCLGGEDELGCPCTSEQFTCRDGSCVDQLRRCDLNPDCPDRSDEDGCPEKVVIEIYPTSITVNVGEEVILQCSVSGHLPRPNIRWTKDGASLPDRATVINGRLVIPSVRPEDAGSYICETVGLVPSFKSVAIVVVEEIVCDDDEFHCDGRCIRGDRRCNRYPDCQDGTDELNCPGCTPDQFKCADGNCIELRQRCDRHYDCIDQSDELSCPCIAGEFECGDGLCIDSGRRCDGHSDCNDGSDEEECFDTPPVFTCGSVTASVGDRRVQLRCEVKSWPLVNTAQWRDIQRGIFYTMEVPTAGYRVFIERVDPDRRSVFVILEIDNIKNEDFATDFELVVPYNHQRFTYVVNIEQVCNIQTEFRCDDGSCIDVSQRCDRNPDCHDRSDEVGCPCTAGEFECGDGLCISSGRRCDGHSDCNDGSDEAECFDTPPVFTCRNISASVGDRRVKLRCEVASWPLVDIAQWRDIRRGIIYTMERQIPGYRVYIERIDPDRRSVFIILEIDEIKKEEFDTEFELEVPYNQRRFKYVVRIEQICNVQTEFRCGDGNCVSLSQRCDRYPDCRDRSDEVGCPCRQGEFQCGDGQCIALRRKCDRRQDCPDGDDEVGCIYCESSEIDCGDGLCLDQSYRCDGRRDCANGEDERNCPTTCRPDEFTCSNQQCISVRAQCNGVDDCGDNSDEADCVIVTCGPNDFTCRDGSCIKSRRRCDGRDDCHDRSDELNCPTTCRPDEFTCTNQQCISVRAQCNGVDDCGDNSDEADCVIVTCGPNDFTCRDGSCIKSRRRCDGRDDCRDRSDEMNCPTTCRPDEFTCTNQQCISVRAQCNGVDDCGDNSDEADCVIVTCGPNDFTCRDGSCIKSRRRCDGRDDCRDRSDEMNCPTTCRPDEFTCTNQQCISVRAQCNGVDDCGDNSDEADCVIVTCGPNDFTCRDGSCIKSRRRCDGRDDCRDRSDEMNCPTTCRPDEFTCTNQQCISVRAQCNGVDDCGDNSDEADCVIVTCGPDDFTCRDGSCIDSRRRCDGRDDCRDRSDELNCPTTCRPDEFTCTNQQCISVRAQCNGVNDCGDNSDEADCVIVTCGPNDFTCRDGSCIDSRRRCDGQGDCHDRSDELNCPTTCRPDQFTCANRRCISIRAQCNGFDDCGDRSDEVDCVEVVVTVTPADLRIRLGADIIVQCSVNVAGVTTRWTKDGHALPATATVIDGRLSILRATELDTGSYICETIGLPTRYTAVVIVSVERIDRCGSDQAECSNGQCIGRYLFCDGQVDCADGSDEVNCTHHPCEPNEFRCRNGLCVYQIWRCDGENDCGDVSDEQGCPTSPPGAACNFDEFMCASGDQCVPASYQCDNETDCLDRSDEIGCVPPTITLPPISTIEVEIGGTITIVCEAIGVPTPLIVWRLNWGHIPTGSRVVTSGDDGRGKLTISNILVSDAGAYTCEAINTKGSIFATPDAIIIIRHTPSQCIPPMFNAEALSRSQCVQCFCSGITDNCFSSSLYLSQVPLGRQISVLQKDTQTQIEQSYIAYDPSTRVFSIPDFRTYLDPQSSYYWMLPSQFLGNQMSSYGGELRYTLYFNNIGTSRPSSEPDVILIGHGRTLQYVSSKHSTPGVTDTRIIPMIEGPWREEVLKDRRVSLERIGRADLLMILQNVTAILIRAVHDDSMSDTRLSNLALSTAGRSDIGLGRAILVEDCNCPTGYSGLSCEECAAGFYRILRGHYFGECVQCQCNGHSNDCDKQTGECYGCLHNTQGPQCEICSEGYYGDARVGLATDCQACPCPLVENSFSRTCILDTDRQVTCTACRQGYEGRQCERCAEGFVGYPNTPGGYCHEKGPDDQCDARGMESIDESGRCVCKENTRGPVCGDCTEDTFFLSQSNPLGCVSCFCMGMTKVCTSTSWNRAQVSVTFTNDQHGVSLTDMMRRRVIEGDFTIDGRTRSLMYRRFNSLPQITYFWSLPRRFLGDKVTSYGGSLRYTISYQPGLDRTPRSDPDVELIGNEITLIYRHPTSVDAGVPTSFQIPLYEDRWIRSDGEPATREHMLMALADLDAVLIRATYTASTAQAKLSDVSLDIAENRITGQGRAEAVEECVCPRGYRGLSCEDCDSGYTRSGGGLYLGLCEQCKCNSHSHDCDPETGVCRNCQHNTEGDHCERCSTGFYGDATHGSTADCQRCPCPLTEPPNQFSHTCVLDNDGQVTCKACPAGHTGRKCERCLPGYDGNPLQPGSYCQKVEPDKCQCDQRGTIPNTHCDSVTQQCQCKAYVQGLGCTTCKAGYFNLDSENERGCLPCFCSGVATECRSSGFYRDRIRPQFPLDGSHNFALTTRRLGNMITDGFRVNAPANEITFVSFDGIQRERQSLYFVLPPRFRGEKVSSYGGMLRFTIEYTAAEDAGFKYMDADVEILSGDHRMYRIFNPSPEPGVPQTFEIPILESSFRMIDGSDPTREIFMTILSDISAIIIRATHHKQMISVSLRDLSLEIAVPTPTSYERAPMVESCTCPEGYTGLSCQSCAGGYVEVEDAPGGPTRCTRCSCYGHAQRCHPETGKCLNCRDNTAGDRCEKCAEGYYGDPTAGTPNDCRPCPCPLTIPSNQFSRSCYLDQRDGRVTCSNCPVGYTGRDCGTCAESYRGNPREPGGKCEHETGDLRPSVTVSPTSISEPIGSTAVLTCQITGREPLNIVWSRVDGRRLPVRGFQGPSYELRLENLVLGDSGRYMCTATNAYGSDRDYGTLEVIGDHVSIRVVEPKSQTISPGDSVQFVCRGVSQVSYTISWTKLGGALPSRAIDQNGVLFISQVRDTDAGTYVCTGSNIFGVSTDSATLSIETTTSAPEVSIDPRYQTVEVGQPVEFRCIATGIPQPSVEWTKSGSGQLSPTTTVVDGVFRIPSASRSDEAEYFCKASNTEGTTDVRTILYVTGEDPRPEPQIDIIIRSTHVVAVIGSVARFECSAGEDIQLVWTRHSAPLPPGSRQEDGILTIPDVQVQYSGRYICTGTTPTGQTGRQIATLEIKENVIPIKERPTARVDPEKQTVQQDTTGTLHCIVTGIPQPTITWSKARGQLSDNHQVDGNILRITKATMQDRGVYVCRAENVAGQAQSYGIVEVERRERPEIEIYPKASQTIEAGGSALFQCRVTAGIPSPTSQWKRAGDLPFTSTTEIMTDNGVIRFMHVTGDEQGSYICEATNEVGTVTSTAVLNIEGGPIIRITPGRSVRAREGETVQIECIGEGSPTPSVFWTGGPEEQPGVAARDEQSIPEFGSAIMRLNRVSPRDAGYYTCVAENDGGRVEERVQLIVEEIIFPADTGVGIAGPERLSVVEGQTLELNCAATGVVQPIYRWRRREGPLPPNHEVSAGVLHIFQITAEYQGDYICSVNTPIASYEAVVTIIISVSPRLVISPQRVTTRPGGSLLLRCRSDRPSSLQITYEWSKVGSVLSPSAIDNDGQLEIRQVTAADAGRYRCIATSDFGQVEAFAEVTIQVPPVVDVSPRDETLSLGQTVQFRCQVTGSPPPRVIWEKQDGALPPQHNINGGVLSIYNIGREDEGRYICTAKNEAGVSRDYAYLRVRDTTSTVDISTESQTIDVGDRVEFECIVTGTPRPEIRWNKLNGPIPASAIIGEGLLIIAQVQPQDAGTYRCTATNEAGSVQSQVTLFVRARPVISVPQDVSTASLGSPATLECDASGYPQPDITWTRAQGQLPIDYVVANGHLTIPKVRREDAGTYMCSASNQYGHADYPVDLVVGALVPYFPQNPRSYISYPPLRDAYLDFDVQVSFKPEATDGLVLYNGQFDTGTGDFMCFGLHESYPEFRFDVGSGPAIIRGNQSLELNKWHTVRLKRDRKQGTLVVNDGPSFSGEARGRFVGLDLSDNLYLGSVPDFRTIPNAAGFNQGFVGSISTMKIDNVDVDIGNDAVELVGIRESQVCRDIPCKNGGSCEPANTAFGFLCHCEQGYAGFTCELVGERCYPGACGTEGRCYDLPGLSGYRCVCQIGKTGAGCQVGIAIVDPFFNKTSFISYPTIWGGLLQLTLRVGIKPKSLDDGIILYNGQRADANGDFVSLTLNGGHIEFRYDTGSGPAVIRSAKPVKLNEWTTIVAERNGREGILTINNDPPVQGSSQGSTLGLNLQLPMYLGGVDPRYRLSRRVGVTGGLIGCIGELRVNGREVNLIEAAAESSNIQDCGDRSPCDKMPCKNGGNCDTVSPTEYKCGCLEDYTGVNCELEMNICITEAPCQNNGECVVNANYEGYHCMCPLGYIGKNCETTIQVGTEMHVRGNGYVELSLELLPHGSGRVPEGIRFTLTTDSTEGLIFWHGQEPGIALRTGDYLSIGLSDGYIQLSYELGSGPALISSEGRVDDGLPHNITITRVGHSGTLQVDDGPERSGKSKGILRMLNLRGNIYLGGVPDLQVMTGDRFASNLNGCISNIILQDRGPLNLDSDAIGGYNVEPCSKE